MLESNTLPLPPSFAHQARSLLITTEPARPQPSGACNFLMVHPSAKSKICACQVYHHDRAAAGTVCDCGHAACYHVHSFGDRPADALQSPKVDLVEKIKRLEDIILAEREARDNDRAEWKREIRAVHEALNPFYRTEEDLRRRFTHLDTKMTSLSQDQRYLEERVHLLDEVDVPPARQSTFVMPSHNSHRVHHSGSTRPGEEVPGSMSSDERSSAASSTFSRHQTPSEALPPTAEPDSPRSSGILDLAAHPRSSTSTSSYGMPRPAVYAHEEPRSSGFLGLEMRKRSKPYGVRKRQLDSPTVSSLAASTDRRTRDRSTRSKSPRLSAAHSYPGSVSRSISSTISPPPRVLTRSLPQPSPTASGYINADRIYQDGARIHIPPVEHRQDGRADGVMRMAAGPPTMALDVLANVSTATNGIH